MKTCEHYEELVSAYADGEVTNDEIRDLFFHLGTCNACRIFFHQVGRLDAFMSSNKPQAIAAVAAPIRKPPIWKRTFAVSYAAAAAVIVFALASISMALFRQEPPPTTVTQTEFVYMTNPVTVVAQPLPNPKTN